jgi:hypothetical protein
MNKSHAVRTCVDGISFASKYEAAVYRLISNAISDKRHRFKINLQVKTLIYGGGLMPDRYWACDFALTDINTTKSILIEAKGYLPTDFRYVINLLASNNVRAFTNLVVVTENDSFKSKHWGDLRVKSLVQFDKYLHTITTEGIHGNLSL